MPSIQFVYQAFIPQCFTSHPAAQNLLKEMMKAGSGVSVAGGLEFEVEDSGNYQEFYPSEGDWPDRGARNRARVAIDELISENKISLTFSHQWSTGDSDYLSLENIRDWVVELASMPTKVLRRWVTTGRVPRGGNFKDCDWEYDTSRLYPEVPTLVLLEVLAIRDSHPNSSSQSSLTAALADCGI